MFVYIKKGTAITEAQKETYKDSIVFDENTGTIWTHKKEFGSVDEALAELKYFGSVAGNSGSIAGAAKPGQVLNIKGADDDYVVTEVGTNGVVIKGTAKLTDALAAAKSAGDNATKALDDYKKINDPAVQAAKAQADKGVQDAASALAEAQAKVASVNATANKGIEVVNTDPKNPTVGIKIDETTAGNVKLEVGANGLKASVVIEDVEVPVTDVESSSNAIDVNVEDTVAKIGLKTDNSGNVQFTQTTTGLKGTVTIPVNSVAAASGETAIAVTPTSGDVKINLKTDNSGNVQFSQTANGLKGNVTLTDYTVTASESTPEGVAKRYTLTQNGRKVVDIDIPKDMVVSEGSAIVSGTWNQDTFTPGTGTGKALKLVISTGEELYINVADLVDAYTGGVGINVSDSNVISIELDTKTVETTGSNDTAAFVKVGVNGLELHGVKKYVDDAVSGLKTAVDAYTVNGKAINTNPVLSGADVALTGYTKPTNGVVEATDTVNAAIAKLDKAAADAAAGGVQSFGGETGVITVDTAGATGKVKFAMSGKQLTGEVVNGVTADNTLTANQLVVGNGNKIVKTLANGQAGEILVVGETGLEWQKNTIIKKDGQVITELIIADSEDNSSVLTKEMADKLYVSIEEYNKLKETVDSFSWLEL